MKLRYFILLLVPLFISCVGEDRDVIPLEGTFAFTPDSQLFSLAVDDSFTLQVEGFDAMTEEVIWTSSNADVAEVDNNGRVIPVSTLTSQEKVTITAELVEIEESATADVAPTKIEISIIISNFTFTKSQVRDLSDEQLAEAPSLGVPTTLEFRRRLTAIDVNAAAESLEAVFTNVRGEEEEVDFIWESSDTSVIIIDSDDNLIPMGVGVAEITLSVDPSLSNKASDIISINKTIEVGEETIVEPDPEPEVTVVASGNFERLDYAVRGSFEIINDNGSDLLVLSNDFGFVDGLPDPVIYLSNVTNSQAGALLISESFSAVGGQTLTIPQGTNVAEYRNVLIYCRRFNQPIGFARINFR